MANEFVAKNGLISQNNSTVSGSLTVTQGITGSLQGTASWATNALTSSLATTAISSSYPIAVIGTNIYSVSPLANIPVNSNNIFLGLSAGINAGSLGSSNFFGQNAGYSASNAGSSNFFGSNAGYQATNAALSNFLGQSAGYQASGSYNSNFLGSDAGYRAYSANNSNFLGYFSGKQASNADNSNFLGYQAGYSASNANNSNFLGYQAGYSALSSSYSTLIGYRVGESPLVYYENPAEYVLTNNTTEFSYDEASGLTVNSATTESFVVSGDYSGNTQPFTCSAFVISDGSTTINVNLTDYYSAPIITSITFDGTYSTFTFNPPLLSEYHNLLTRYDGIGANNIIIGTNITLADSRRDSINIGGIIFGTGSHSDTSGAPTTESVGGRIGINVVNPQYTLDVSGSGKFTSGLVVTGSLTVSGSSTFTNIGPAIFSGSVTSTNGFTGSLLGTSTTASYLNPGTYNITSSWSTNALTASLAPNYVLTSVTSSMLAPYLLSSQTSSFVTSAQTGSFITSAQTSSMTVATASWATSSLTASYISPTFISASAAASGFGSGGGSGANVTASFTNQSTWTFNHALNNQGVIIQTFDSSWNQIIPQNIELTNANTATITFTSARSGYAIASLGGVAVVANTNAVFAQTASLAYTASYAVTSSATTAFDGAWASYNVVWTSDQATQPVIGNGTLTGYYKQIGKTVFVRVKLNAGTTTTFGAGAWQFSLPVTASSADGIQFPCSLLDNTVAWYGGTVNGTYGGFTHKTSIITPQPSTHTQAAVSATSPFTWGSTDSLQFNGSYEAV